MDPLLLDPFRYGLLGVVFGALALLAYLTESPVHSTILRFGSLVLLCVLCSAVFSGYFWNGLEYALIVGVATVGLSVQGRSSSPTPYRNVSRFFLVLGGFYLVVLGVGYVEQIELFGQYGLFRLPPDSFRNPNVVGRFFGLAALVVGVSSLPRGIRYGGAFLFAVPVLLSGSRGALLALFVAFACVILRNVDFDATGRLVRWGGLVLVLLGIGLIVGRPDYVTNLQRLKLVVESLAMAAREPFLGVGGWNFGLVYPSVSLDAYWQRHAHSLPFQVLAEFGLVGFGLLVGGLLFFVNSRPRTCWLPVPIFLLAHETVDTMIWLPGMLLLGLFALRPFGRRRGNRVRSTLLLVVGSLVLGLGTLVWSVDHSYRQYLAGPIQDGPVESSALSGVAGFDAMNRFVAEYRRTGTINKELLAEGLRHNDYDPYYDWLAGRTLRAAGEADLGRRFLRRYARKDPRGMLGLSLREGDESDPAESTVDFPDYGEPSLRDVIGAPTHPGTYFPVVAESLERERYDRARRQIRHLETYPRLTSELQRELDALERSLDARTASSDSSGGRPTADLDRKRRRQYHQFFYRRPGRDYVSFR